MEVPETFTKALDPNSNLITWELAGTIFIIAAIAMSFVQVLKDILPLRWGFQQFWVSRWVAVRAQKFQAQEDTERARPARSRRREATADTPSTLQRLKQTLRMVASGFVYIVLLKFIWETDEFSSDAWKTLIELGAGGRKRVMFRLPAEQLVAQISAATQIVLEYPIRHVALLKVFSQGADIADIDLFLRLSPDTAKPTSKEKGDAPDQRYLDARNRIAHRIQRNLDAIHIALAGDWKLLMQLLAFGFSFGLALFTVYAIAKQSGSHYPLVITAFVGVTSGYAASVFSDFIAAIHSLRRQ
jgi:hypothetical protein